MRSGHSHFSCSFVTPSKSMCFCFVTHWVYRVTQQAWVSKNEINHWSTGDSRGGISLMTILPQKPSTENSCQTHDKACGFLPHLWLNVDWTSLMQEVSGAVSSQLQLLCRVQKAALHSLPLHPPVLAFFPPHLCVLLWALEEVMPMSYLEKSTQLTCPQHLIQQWILALITVHWK